MSFLDSKMLKNPGDVSGEKEYIPRSKMFPCYGNFYNWWAKACFECLMIENDTMKKMTEETIFLSFLHVEKAYEMHKGKPRKWHWN